jgi:hypothetical protein
MHLWLHLVFLRKRRKKKVSSLIEKTSKKGEKREPSLLENTSREDLAVRDSWLPLVLLRKREEDRAPFLSCSSFREGVCR